VYIVGYDRVFGDPAAPFVEIGNVSSHYNFSRTTSGNITLREQSQYREDKTERPALAQFRTKLFSINDANMTKDLRIYSSANTLVGTIDHATLKSEIAGFKVSQGITSLEGTPDLVIPIIIEFEDNRDLSVSITIPRFEVKPVEPEFPW
jgi:hypothetical protein